MVAVVQIGIVPVGMRERVVTVDMRMRLSCRVARNMRMLVMFVMDVLMFVFNRLMGMVVFMPLRKMQPHTCGHQTGRNKEAQ